MERLQDRPSNRRHPLRQLYCYPMECLRKANILLWLSLQDLFPQTPVVRCKQTFIPTPPLQVIRLYLTQKKQF